MGSYFPSYVELRGSYWKSWANTPPFFIFPHNSIALREFENSPSVKFRSSHPKTLTYCFSELPPFFQNVQAAAADSSRTFIAQCKMEFVQRMDITKSVMVLPRLQEFGPSASQKTASWWHTVFAIFFWWRMQKMVKPAFVTCHTTEQKIAFVSISAAVVRSLTFVVFGQ
jgi:hypothetical protein